MGQRLGVNVDHVATLRQARRTTYPDPVTAAALVISCSGSSIASSSPRVASKGGHGPSVVIARKA